MKHNFYNSYGKIDLRPIGIDDIESLRLLRNKHRNCFIYSDIITAEAQQDWYYKYLSKPDDYVFSVFMGDKWIGSVSIYNIENREAEFGRLLIDSNSINEKGLGLSVTLCVCKLAFSQMNISRIVLQVYEDNISAYKTYIRAGFKTFGHSFDSNGKKLLDMELYVSDLSE
ncbi:MAG: GNAT family N-acetyltransferase [Clostridia bacterium]|nr:GNAT family N-acetyltransferase [Clostridia bacterium]